MISKPLKIKILNAANLSGILDICKDYPELPWSSTQLQEGLLQPHTIALGLFTDSRLVAFSIFNVALDEAELLLIATHVDFIRQGYGLCLLEHAIALFAQKNIQKLFLEVRASNHAAIKLYERCQFTSLSVRKNYYPLADTDQREDALIMSLLLT
jgi:ribosomal-protein-alanine N-acetyltransferase